MTAPLNPSFLAPIGIGALILWRLYSRVRRMVGRQHFSPARPWITVCLLPVITVLLLSASIGKPMSALALGGGVAVGIGLGRYGLRMTRFETTPQGHFYTPNAHLGIALSLLLVGRIIYRLIQAYWLSGSVASAGLGPGSGSGSGSQFNYATTPLTMLIFGTLAGYYVTYAIGLLRWQRKEASGG